MTVCVAALCKFFYPTKDGEPLDEGFAAIVASDRMMTSGDVQYEPNQMKIAQMSKSTVLLIAGDYSLHTEAIRATVAEISGRPNASPKDIALIYGRMIQAIKRRQAEDLFLAPVGLNTDLLSAQQREMSEGVLERLVTQMQNYRGEDVDALVVGADEKRKGNATILHVDTNGTVSCVDDIGFAAIGSGSWHARSQLMLARYTPHELYLRALTAVYAAKKAAEISPGVGARFTDIHVVFRSGPERLLDEHFERLKEIFEDTEAKRAELTRAANQAMIDFIYPPKASQNDDQGKPGKDAEANAGVGSDASETARTNEGPENAA